MKTTTQRDMTTRQFVAACERRGFGAIGYMGYTPLAPPCDNTHVSVHNAGSCRLRAILAYLIAEQAKAEKKIDAAT